MYNKYVLCNFIKVTEYSDKNLVFPWYDHLVKKREKNISQRLWYKALKKIDRKIPKFCPRIQISS